MSRLSCTDAPVEPWTDEERAWARDCFYAGDSLEEIADTAGRSLMDVARAIGVAGFVPLEGRWRRSSGRSAGWVGGMQIAVVAWRARAGERQAALAAEARVGCDTLRGALRRYRSLAA